MVKFIFILATVFAVVRLSGQNLVPNPGFETVTDEACVKQKSMNAIPCVEGWKTVQGLPDYVNHRLNDHDARAPLARDGDAMVGLYMPYPQSTTLEFIEARLIQPLAAGQRYRAEVCVARDLLHYPYPANNIGMYFSKTPFAQNVTEQGEADRLGKISAFQPQVMQGKKHLPAKNEWVAISGEFVAEGGEQYLCIGRFRMDETAISQGAYYYIDHVSVVPVNSPGTGAP